MSDSLDKVSMSWYYGLDDGVTLAPTFVKFYEMDPHRFENAIAKAGHFMAMEIPETITNLVMANMKRAGANFQGKDDDKTRGKNVKDNDTKEPNSDSKKNKTTKKSKNTNEVKKKDTKQNGQKMKNENS